MSLVSGWTHRARLGNLG